jgi:hypothetical protein
MTILFIITIAAFAIFGLWLSLEYDRMRTSREYWKEKYRRLRYGGRP